MQTEMIREFVRQIAESLAVRDRIRIIIGDIARVVAAEIGAQREGRELREISVFRLQEAACALADQQAQADAEQQQQAGCDIDKIEYPLIPLVFRLFLFAARTNRCTRVIRPFLCILRSAG